MYANPAAEPKLKPLLCRAFKMFIPLDPTVLILELRPKKIIKKWRRATPYNNGKQGVCYADTKKVSEHLATGKYSR